MADDKRYLETLKAYHAEKDRADAAEERAAAAETALAAITAGTPGGRPGAPEEIIEALARTLCASDPTTAGDVTWRHVREEHKEYRRQHARALIALGLSLPRCRHCGDLLVWHEGNGGQWLGAVPPRDWATCHGRVEGQRHEPGRLAAGPSGFDAVRDALATLERYSLFDHGYPRNVDVPDDYEQGVQEAAAVLRAALEGTQAPMLPSHPRPYRDR